MCFGGPNMDKLFVATSSVYYFNYFDVNGPTDEPIKNPLTGRVFMIEGLCAKGLCAKRLKSPVC